MTSSTSKMPAITPRRTMQGHTSQVLDIAHLHDGRRIIVCSSDGSLLLWDLENDVQVGVAWRDEGHKADVKKIALSPSGKTVASGSDSGTVRLWDVKTGRVIARWMGHTENVGSVCWSGDGERVVSGSWDGTARVWDVKTGRTVLEIKNGHQYVWAVTYSPDNTKFATGGENENAVKIWNAKTGELLSTLHQDQSVRSLAWTSDGKKLLSGSLGPIEIFDTVTWEQIAVLKGHIFNLTLARNDHFLASTSIWDETVCLWNLNTNLPVCLPFQHDKDVSCLAFSADGKSLVTACEDNVVYLWDIYAILKEIGLEELLSISDVSLICGLNHGH
ncbi:WD40 repeat-like protein [Suillus hirtellus]|nr:WD40 repeat-like protein [Suillus hirtellus]